MSIDYLWRAAMFKLDGNKPIRFIKWAVPPALVILGFFMYVYLYFPLGPTSPTEPVESSQIAEKWRTLGGGLQGKVVFSRPPHMIILDLENGKESTIEGILTTGSRGKRLRGHSPRPSWSPRGDAFLYRYQKQLYLYNLKEGRGSIHNPLMDTGNETRWSWWQGEGHDWAVGPSKKGNALLVNLADTKIVKLLYMGGDIKKHCELTGTGNYLVYSDGDDIFSVPRGTKSRNSNYKISKGQSCRPCAAPDDRVAWLPNPHDRYWIHHAATGENLGALHAPEDEEIYRLNWSNHPDFAVHMYGSRGNERMHVRKISTGESIYIGCGWDPDLWVEIK